MNRRAFVTGVTVAGAGGLVGLRPGGAGAAPPPETPRIRLLQTVSICQAPQYVAEELLRAEGFTDVQYIKKEGCAIGSWAVPSSPWAGRCLSLAGYVTVTGAMNGATAAGGRSCWLSSGLALTPQAWLDVCEQFLG